MNLVTVELCSTLKTLAEPLGHLDRAVVVWANDADDVVSAERGEGVIECNAGTFCRETSAPVAPYQSPTEFKARPALGIEESDSTDDGVGVPLYDGPHAIAPQVPVADDHSKVTPRFLFATVGGPQHR